MTTEEIRSWMDAGVSIDEMNWILAHEEIGSKFPMVVSQVLAEEKLTYWRNALDWLISKRDYILLHKEFSPDTQKELLALLDAGDVQGFHAQMQQLDNSGDWDVTVDIRYVREALHDDFPRALLTYIKDKDYGKLNAAIDWFNFIWVWDNKIDTAIQQGNIEALCNYESDVDGEITNIQMHSTKERREQIVGDVLDAASSGINVNIEIQYSGTAFIFRRLFFNQSKKLLRDMEGHEVYETSFTDRSGVTWDIEFWTEKYASPYDTLEPFDYALLDVFFTLYCYGIRIVTVDQLDMLLSGNDDRVSGAQKIARIKESIDRLTAVHVGFTVRGNTYPAERLLDIDCFEHLTDENGTYSDTYVYLHGINSLYSYARDFHEIANAPKEYYDTAALPDEYKFNDTETAIILKRRVITKVMGILRMSRQKGRLYTNWNRLSLEQKQDKTKGILPELDLMPHYLENATEEENDKIYKKWRKKEKPVYVDIVRGTLENMKANYAFLDYEDVFEGKGPRYPLIGFDIICFTQTELNALQKLRDEQKKDYVQGLMDKRSKAKSDKKK